MDAAAGRRAAAEPDPARPMAAGPGTGPSIGPAVPVAMSRVQRRLSYFRVACESCGHGPHLRVKGLGHQQIKG